jgi:hypothetical protein
MSKKILIDAFFNQFNAFLTAMNEMYPDDEDFPVFITTLSMMRTTNPMAVLKFVKSEIIDLYYDKIQAKDESFFMNEDYSTRDDVNLNIIDKIKQYILGMSPATKDAVWKYIDIITKLCSKALDS